MFFVNGKRVSLVAFLDTLYCTQNCKFYYFLETKICFVKKKCSISSYVYICPKISKNDSRIPFIKKLLDSILYAQSFSVHNIP